MKHTLLITLLGAAVTLATPSLTFADNGNKYKNSAMERNHQHKHKHGTRHHHKNDKKRFVAKPPKTHRDKNNNRIKNQYAFNKQGYDRHGYNKYGYNRYGFNKRGYNKHGYNRQGYNKHGHNKHYVKRHNDQPKFSVSWNVGDSTITYGDNGYNRHYNSGYNNNNHNNPRKNRGKKIYKRIHNQANRIQNGIRNGQLVNREVRKLRREQSHIKQTLSHYKRDGRLNKYESKQLNQLLNVSNDNIYHKMNNHRTRYSRHNDYYAQF